MNDAMKHDTDRWPEEARLDMIEKSEWYENPQNYQYGYYDGYQRARAEMLANARLIAAAPAMYEALQMIIAEIEASDEMLKNGHVCGLTRKQMDGVLLARAALRTADGGE